ncbi:MAG: hypothetical protein ACLRW5_10050 [Faecalibacterium prausnitzii]
MNLYVAEQEFDERGETTIKTVSEISQDELNALNEAFSFCGVSHTITEIRDIVIENGAAFKKWMTPKNLKSQYDNKMSPEELVRTANKLILNYATSTKTYIDIETRILAQNETKSKRTLESLTMNFMINIWNIDFGQCLEIMWFIAHSRILFFMRMRKMGFN